MPIIFISYRRDDTPGYAGRLYDRILREFGRDNVFIDVDALQPGDDFVDAIREKLEKCDLMLALIGKRWLTATDDQGRPRLEDEGDYVRIEIQTALDRRLRTIPVLVERAAMPRLQDLPQPLRLLARRQAIELSDTRWEYDVGTLVEHVKRVAAGQAAGAKPTLASIPSHAGDSQITSAAPPDAVAQQHLQTDRHEEEAATQRAQEEARGREEIEAATVHSHEEERKKAEKVRAEAGRAREDELREMEAKATAERAREEERKRSEAEVETTRISAQEQKRLDTEAKAAATRAREAERKQAEAVTKRTAEHAREEARERLDAVAQRAREEERIGLEADPALARAPLEDEGRLGQETEAATDLRQLGERVAESDTPWSTPVVALSVAALGTATIAALQAFPEFVGLRQTVLPSLLTTVLLLGIVFVRRDAPRRYRFLIAAGFLAFITRDLLFIAAPIGELWIVGEILRLCAYGCWITAFTRRGAVRLSPWIVPYLVAAIMIVVLQWPRVRPPILSALVTLTIAAMAWTAFEVSRQSKYSSLRWAVWGTAIWLVALGYYWVAFITTFDSYGRVPSGHQAAVSLFIDVATWLIAMSVRNENRLRGSPPTDQQQLAVSILSAS